MEFSVPAFLTQKVHDGPDFTVTYLSSEEKKMGMGIYEGSFPQEGSKGRPGVRREEEKIAGQRASWALWEDEVDSVKRVRFEVFLAVSPGRPPSDKFHLFGYAASTADLDILRSIVRSAHQKEEANQAAQTTPGLRPSVSDL
ncbi:MAG: hypothetical protein WDM96_11910 [Lacunisphaera sp.]